MLLLSLPVALSAAPAAWGQSGVRPGDERPELPEPLEEAPARDPLALPPLDEVAPPARGELSSGLRVFVRQLVVEGSTVFGPEDFAPLTEPYTNREITSAELLEVRDRITLLYVNRGYVTSGAMVPDQDVQDGVVRIRVVEGVLAGVEVAGTERFRPSYFERLLAGAAGAPVDVVRIERELQRLQREPQVKRVRARLLPSEVRGQSRLALEVEEERPYSLAGTFSNHEPPSIGELSGDFRAGLANIAGWGDALSARFNVSGGLRDVDTRYDLPFYTWPTVLSLRFRWSESEVQDEALAFLGIESESITAGLALRHPLYRSESHQVWLGLAGDYRTAKSEAKGFLLGDFCFDEGTGRCRKKVAVLRPHASWTWRTRRQVVAARVQASFGIDALGATIVGNPDAPDGEFVSGLFQLQWAYRLPRWLLGSEVLARADAQLANRPLLSIERFSLGGVSTVRGYRENEIVRDNGVVTSVELRVPLWSSGLGRPIVQAGPFFDWGRGWNSRSAPLSPADRTLMSVGIGVRVAPFEWLRGSFYWGHRLEKVSNPHDSIQDEGIHFEINAIVF